MMQTLIYALGAMVILPFVVRILTGSDKLALASIVAVIAFILFR
jgi:hypothetical protein